MESFQYRRRLLLAVVVILVVVGYWVWGEWSAMRKWLAAQEAIDRRQFADAVERLEECKRAWPDSGEVAFLLGRTARRKSDFAIADYELERAERLNWPRDSIDFERALMRIQQGRRGSEDALMTASRQGNEDALYIVEVLGPIYVQRFAPNLALELTERWAELQPKAAEPLYWLGEVSKQLQRPDEARDYFAKTLELDPNHRKAAVRLATELLEVREYREALKVLDPFLARLPEDREIRLLVVHACSEPSQEARARTIAESLCAELPDDPQVQLERGRLELRSQNFGEAEKWLRRSLEKRPFDPQVVFNLASALGALGKLDEEKKYRARFHGIEDDQRRLGELTRKLAQNSSDIDSRVEMGIILRRNEQLAPALDWLVTALEIDPKSPRVHREVAAVFERMGNTDKMKLHLNLAKQYEK